MAVIIAVLCIVLYCVDKEIFALVFKFIFSCACFEDYNQDVRSFRQWQTLSDEDALPTRSGGGDVEAPAQTQAKSIVKEQEDLLSS